MAQALRAARLRAAGLRASAGLVLFAMAVTALASLLHATRNPEYSASSRLLLGPALPAAALQPVGQEHTEPLVADFQLSVEAEAAIIPSVLVAERVARALKLTTPPEQLADSVTASPLSGAVVEVQASSSDPQLAVELANGFADQYLAYRRAATDQVVAALMRELDARSAKVRNAVRKLDATFQSLVDADASAAPEEEAARQSLITERERRLAVVRSLDLQATRLRAAGSAQAVGGAVVSRAAVPKGGPQTIQTVAMGMLVGGAVGGSLSVLRRRLGLADTTRTRVDAVMGMPVLASVPVGRTAPNRTLSRALVARGLGTSLRTMVVTAAERGEGVTSVVADLAAACAGAGLPTMVLSVDLVDTGLPEAFDLGESARRRTTLPDEGSWIAGLIHVLPDLMVLPVGVPAGRLQEILDDAATLVSVVLVETPPLAESGAAIAIGARCDVVLLAAGHLDDAALEAAARTLTRLRRPVQVVVVTNPAELRTTA
jgi:capsular polysaccharide biosynthesis protein